MRRLVAGLLALAIAVAPLASSARPHGKRHGTTAARSHAVARRPPAPKPLPAESIGHPNDGRLENGAHLDASKPYLRVVPAYRSGDVRWGLPVLVEMLDRAGKAVAKKYPGSVLNVGDISRKGGGDVLRHHSHESGRDADVGFYVVDASGKEVLSHGFVKIDDELRAVGVAGARFDLGRNWLLVERLLDDPHARVSHVFIAEPLRAALLAYGRQHGATRRLLDRAAIALMQPTSSLPHDDHMHVRISCPRSMRDVCIEDSKNAPHPHAATPRPHARPALRTPRPASPAGPRPPRDEPSLARDEAEADAAEVKDLVDELGSVKLTD